ncbi:zf-HC2 domain-containing protein [Actinomycetospora sp. CA-084318]|uniref:zf-HC2 domain-containing protein n=1 Tax=Actinomycetospora sp. CA-084318 TaxID=3239892 RepID=UPI003D990B68
MNPSPDDWEHRELRERLGAYVLGGLDATEHRAVDAHLTDCPSCRAERDAIAPLAAPLRAIDPDRLDDAVPAGPGPAGLDAVRRRVHAEDTQDTADLADAADLAGTARPQDAAVTPLARRRPRVRLLLAAGAVVVALAGGAVGYGLGVRGAEGPQEPVAVQALVPGVEADAATIAHTWGVEVVLTARGFEPGRTYLVAVTDRDGRSVGAGAFVGTGGNEMVCRLNSPVLPREATGFVVTTTQGDEVVRSRFV